MVLKLRALNHHIYCNISQITVVLYCSGCIDLTQFLFEKLRNYKVRKVKQFEHMIVTENKLGLSLAKLSHSWGRDLDKLE